MTLGNQLSAIGIPPLVYDWSIDSLQNCKAKKDMLKLVERVENMIKNSGVVIIILPGNNLLASRLAVTLLKAAILKGVDEVEYIAADKIKDIEAESWDSGDLYDEYLRANLLAIDSINTDMHPTKFQAYLEFLEARLRNKKATILSSSKDETLIINDRIKDILNNVICHRISLDAIK